MSHDQTVRPMAATTARIARGDYPSILLTEFCVKKLSCRKGHFKLGLKAMGWSDQTCHDTIDSSPFWFLIQTQDPDMYTSTQTATEGGPGSACGLPASTCPEL